MALSALTFSAVPPILTLNPAHLTLYLYRSYLPAHIKERAAGFTDYLNDMAERYSDEEKLGPLLDFVDVSAETHTYDTTALVPLSTRHLSSTFAFPTPRTERRLTDHVHLLIYLQMKWWELQALPTDAEIKELQLSYQASTSNRSNGSWQSGDAAGDSVAAGDASSSRVGRDQAQPPPSGPTGA